MKKNILLFCLFLLFFGKSVLWGQESPLILSDLKGVYSFQNASSFYEDKTGTLSFEKAIKQKFTLLTQNSINFGVTSSAIWLRITVKNSSPNQNPNYLLGFEYPLIDHVDFYYSSAPNQWQVEHSGDMLPFDQRSVSNRNFIFNLSLKDTATQTYYIRFRTSGSLQVTPTLYTPQELLVDNIYSEITYGLFFGSLLIIILYNIFLFFSLKDYNYLYYIFGVFSTFLLQAGYSAHTVQYLWGNYPYIANISIPLSMHFTNLAICYFAIKFLDAKKYAPRLNKLFLAITLISLVMLSVSFLIPMRIAISSAGAVSLFNSIFLIILGIVCLKSGNKSARYFLLAWVFFLIGGVMLSFRNFGFIEPNFVTSHAMRIGAVLEVFLLSLALSDKYNLFKKEKELAQAEIIKMQKEANEVLEKKVVERTIEIQEKKQQIEEQRDKLLSLNEEINQQKEEIQTQHEHLQQIYATLFDAKGKLDKAYEDIKNKNTHITNSINYARRIQHSMLPPNEVISSYFAETFVFFQPKDIVSGDFYWCKKKEDKVFMTAADCTGHGVPGAFMSMVGTAILNQIIIENGITTVEQIMTLMHESIRFVLRQEQTEGRDGMDLVFCVYDPNHQTVEYAGAMNSIFYVQNNEFFEIKATKKPIGGKQDHAEKRTFTKHLIDVSCPTTMYLCSDGYQDQFGGTEKRKFMSKRFKQLLYSINSLNLNEQKEILEATLKDWMETGREEQTDDIMVIGIRF